jgi:DNA polymerase-3 subunit alpha
MKTLEVLIKTHKGTKELNFIVFQVQDNIKLHMPSRKFKMNITQELLATLEKNEWKFEIK